MKRILPLAVLLATAVLCARTSHVRHDFAEGINGWGGWCDDPGNAIKVTTNEVDGHKVLDLKGSGGWLTPIRRLDKGIKCTDRTMLAFRIWADEAITCDINIGNAEEQAQYSITFELPAKTWVDFKRYIAASYYRLQGSPDIPNDGFVGDTIYQIQVAVRGKHVMMDTFEIYEADSTGEKEYPPDAPHVKPQQMKTAQLKKIVKRHLALKPLTQYTEVGRNGFFPFAVVSRLDANDYNSKQFGEDLEASLRRDLLDMRRHYINTYYDFCVGDEGLVERLRRSEEYGMRIVETCFCHVNFLEAPNKTVALFEEAKESPAILGWYGQDEPVFEHVEGYLANKRWVNEHDTRHPYTSAMHLDQIRRLVGPAMEVAIPDIYSLRPNSPLDAPQPMLDHAPVCRGVLNMTGGKCVWFMTQTFSNRHPNANRSPVFSSRYPTPLEIRLDMYSTLAGGARGISFFIYNDHVPFLGGIRGEKFDYTLVDPWGNDNPTYREIADFGKRVVPVMPSIMDAEFSHDIEVKFDDKSFLLAQLKNAQGTYLHVVNRSLAEKRTAKLELELPAGAKVYSLFSLTESSLSVELAPGMGEILAIAVPADFTLLKREIEGRRQEQEDGLKALRLAELKAAGFGERTVTGKWLNEEKALKSVQAAFGTLYQELVKPERIVTLDSNPDYADLHDQLCALSRRYFEARAVHAKGGAIAIQGMTGEIQKLQESYLQRFEK